jgi:two-component system cell cycle sensor histidine kinase/response regulator CckA
MSFHEQDPWLRALRGPLAVATLAVVLEVVSQGGVTIPHVDAFLILVVAYVAFVDGIVAGLGGAVLAVLYYAYTMSSPGRAFHLAVFEWEHVVIVGIATPVLALIIGKLRRELEATRAREKDARSELETVLEGLTAGFYTVDPGGRIKYVNPRATEIIGASRDQLVGRSAAEIEPPLPAAEEGGGLARALALRESVSYELHDEVFDTWLDVQVHPLERNEGVAVYFADVTERRRIQERVHGAAKMEALGRLAGGIAHDFNNLLTAIRGFNDLVLHDLEPGDPRRASLEQVARAAERAARLTHQILAYTKRQVLQPQALDLNLQVSEMATMVRRLVRERVSIETVLDAKLFPARVDAGQFEQIVLNLVLNASDAMPRGGRITIRTSCAEIFQPRRHGRFVIEPGDYAIVTVEDTGTGMDAKTLERIFEPFFTTKDRAHGTGLGLSTVYGIVKQSGGYILVESQPGVGSRFDVWLPRAEGTPASVESDEPGWVASSAGATVLVVEDDEAVRALSTTVLRGEGYRVIETRDGIEALSAAGGTREPIDVLFTDIVLPGMSGRELAERLRATRPQIRVLFTSGYTNNNLIQDGIARGVLPPQIEFLHKPFTPAELLGRVNEVLREPVVL